jgi:hypothetical protein
MLQVTNETEAFISVSCLFCEYWQYFDVVIWIIVYYKKETPRITGFKDFYPSFGILNNNVS